MAYNVFLDSSVIIKENFLKSKKIAELKKYLHEGKINMFMHMINYNEVLKHARLKIIESTNSFNALRKRIKIFQNIESVNHLSNKLDSEKLVVEMMERFNEYIQSINLINYGTIETSALFDNYFNETNTFKNKKDEFPDAIALISIEKWCVENKTTAVVLSEDGDMMSFDSKFIEVYSLSDFMAKLILEEGQSALLIEVFNSNLSEVEEKLKSEIIDWVKDQLYQTNTYLEYTYNEVHDIKIKHVDVLLNDNTIIGVDRESTYVNAEFYAIVNLDVEVDLDDNDYTYYDKETGEVISTHSKIERITKKLDLNFNLTAGIDLESNKINFTDIYNINNGNDLELVNYNF